MIRRRCSGSKNLPKSSKNVNKKDATTRQKLVKIFFTRER